MATCPECDADLAINDDDLDEMEPGDPWDCEACGSRLRVAGIDPLEFDADDDDDDDDEDEDDDDPDEKDDDDDDDGDEDDDSDDDDDSSGSGGGEWDE